jgi:hypothetical protein
MGRLHLRLSVSFNGIPYENKGDLLSPISFHLLVPLSVLVRNCKKLKKKKKEAVRKVRNYWETSAGISSNSGSRIDVCGEGLRNKKNIQTQDALGKC